MFSQEKIHEVRAHGKFLREDNVSFIVIKQPFVRVPLSIGFNLAWHPNPAHFLSLYFFYPMNQRGLKGCSSPTRRVYMHLRSASRPPPFGETCVVSSNSICTMLVQAARFFGTHKLLLVDQRQRQPVIRTIWQGV